MAIQPDRSWPRPLRRGEQATFRLVTVKARDKGGEDKLFIFATNTGLKPMEIRRMFRSR